MNPSIAKMLDKYECHTLNDTVQALREIMQEVALLGLWRNKFFEHAAFYGGTSLRILYGLPRFSEDLDFSLLKPNSAFDLKQFSDGLERELSAFGFTVSVEMKNKSVKSAVQSAFLKADTVNELLVIEAPESVTAMIPHGQKIRIKIEVDTNPPPKFSTEMKYLLQPIPFAVRCYQLPDLFAGKMHAVLFRQWKNRVKGRDWYDLQWYIAHHPKLNIEHLKQRMIQTEDWEEDKVLTGAKLLERLHGAIDKLSITQAQKDIAPFIRDQRELDMWSKDFFHSIVEKIEFV